jgi:enoyl-CoA hydratase/carnithine racemase
MLPMLSLSKHAQSSDPALGAICVITLADRETRNALSRAMIAALAAGLSEAEADPAIRVIILAAEGPAFCSGHDLKEITRHRADPDKGRAFFGALLAECAALMLQITSLSKPVVAAVEGVATAAGCQLVATADLAIAGDAATFQTPGVHIGLFCSTPMVALSRAVGRKAAMEMLLTGDPIDARTAKEIGLVNRIAPKGEALAQALKLARQIAEKSPVTLKIGKQAFYRQDDMALEEAYAYASGVMLDNMLAPVSEEGIGAFLQKRPPRWL